MTSTRSLAVLLVFGLACSSTSPGYKVALANAHNAKRNGQSELARAHYEKASRLAETDEERAEADYRAAHLLLPGESVASRIDRLLSIAQKYPKSTRASRALLDAAHIYVELAELRRAAATYEKVIVSHPKSPSADLALGHLLRVWQTEGQTPEFVSKGLDRLKRAAPGLSELILFSKAKLIEPHDRARAIELYEHLAVTFPLPRGRYSDEALLRSARLRIALGDAEGAEIILKTLAEAHRESMLVGSYSRSAYGQAAFMRAELRHELQKDTPLAIRLFQAFPQDFPTSRQRDDAVFRAADLLLGAGRASEACQEIQKLKRVDPNSRYHKCEPVFCSSAARSGVCESPSPSLLPIAGLTSSESR